MAQRERELLERKRRERLMYHQQQLAEAENEDENDDYEIGIVRGRDGNFYYVKRPVRAQHRTKQQPTIIEEKAHRSRRELQPDLVVVEGESEDPDSDYETDNEYEEEYESEWNQRRPELDVLSQRLEPQRHDRNHSRRTSPKRRIITVTVEDASDSECESEFDSPWRNRRPSPGQWMEPVEPFYG